MMEHLRKLFFVLLALTFGINVANAQDEEITDEQLQRYAVAMDSVENMKQAIIDMMTTEVENNENITGGRFNELSDIIEDSVKLAEANATDEEIAFILGVKEKKDKMTAEINDTFKSLAIDYIGDGGRIYNRIKKALRSDEELKEKYEKILEDLNEEAEDAKDDAADAAEDVSDDMEDAKGGM